MKITMYELLGMVKDGKAPKKVIYDGNLWEFNKDFNQYQTKKDGGNLWNGYNFNILNDEVEIIEKKKIPEKLEILPNNEQYSNEILYGKINEILDYLDYLKSKGD